MNNTNQTVTKIVNDGKEIAPGTNFWDSETALAGKFIIYTHAGCFRLLLPDKWLSEVPDMIKGAKHVVISVLDCYGDESVQPIVEFMIEDGSDSPYVLATAAGGMFGIPPRSDVACPWTAAIWGRKNGRIHKFMERPAHVRYVSKLPCPDKFLIAPKGP